MSYLTVVGVRFYELLRTTPGTVAGVIAP